MDSLCHFAPLHEPHCSLTVLRRQHSDLDALESYLCLFEAYLDQDYCRHTYRKSLPSIICRQLFAVNHLPSIPCRNLFAVNYFNNIVIVHVDFVVNYLRSILSRQFFAHPWPILTKPASCLNSAQMSHLLLNLISIALERCSWCHSGIG